jgi:hypothetical protein
MSQARALLSWVSLWCSIRSRRTLRSCANSAAAFADVRLKIAGVATLTAAAVFLCYGVLAPYVAALLYSLLFSLLLELQYVSTMSKLKHWFQLSQEGRPLIVSLATVPQRSARV